MLSTFHVSGSLRKWKKYNIFSEYFTLINLAHLSDNIRDVKNVSMNYSICLCSQSKCVLYDVRHGIRVAITENSFHLSNSRWPENGEIFHFCCSESVGASLVISVSRQYNRLSQNPRQVCCQVSLLKWWVDYILFCRPLLYELLYELLKMSWAGF